MIGERKLHDEARSELSGQIEAEEFCPACTEFVELNPAKLICHFGICTS